MFQFRAPFAPGTYRESFKPLAEMLAWTNDIYEQSFGIRVDSPGTFKWTTEGYQVLDQNNSTFLDPGHLQPGQIYTAKMHGFNTGSATWTNSGPTPVVLGNVNGGSGFCLFDKWIACNRAAVLIQSSVAPGQAADFMFQFRAPFAPGTYREDFKPLAEMLSWTNDTYGQTLGIKVDNPGTYHWSSGDYQFFTSDESAAVDPGNLQTNTTYLVKLNAWNTGSATWTNSGPTPVVLGTTNPSGRNSVLCLNAWISCTRPAVLQEASVAPGQLGHFKFLIKTPSSPGTYREDFKPLAEMLSWTNDTYGQTLGIIVH